MGADELQEFNDIIIAARDTTLIDEAERHLANAGMHIARLDAALHRYRTF
jgi:hypothetical protein